MAPKAQKRTLKTTRPRRNAAGIAQERARKPGRASAGRGSDDSGERSRPKSVKSAQRVKSGKSKKSPGRATRVARRERGTEVRRGRFLLLVGFMAVLGFTTVYLGDTALSTFQSLEMDGKATSLWDKIVDRLLDRDIPLVEPAKKPKPSAKATGLEKRAALEKRAPLEANKPAVPVIEKLPRASVPTTPRAELPAPSPVEYAKEAKEHTAPAQAHEQDAAAARAARMEALLEKVGVER